MSIAYDLVRNEVTITSCTNCPFRGEKEDGTTHEFMGGRLVRTVDIVDCCELGAEIENNKVPPVDCPLRDPNFKLTRDFGQEETEEEMEKTRIQNKLGE